MNKINQIAFTGTTNIAPHNWQTTLKDKPRMLKTMESFDKFVREELPDDVSVKVDLFDDGFYSNTKCCIIGGSDDVPDEVPLNDTSLEDLEEPIEGTLIKGRTPMKNMRISIEAHTSNRDDPQYYSSIAGQDFKSEIKNIKWNLSNLFE